MSYPIGSKAFEWAVEHTLKKEGVFSDHGWDPGGATRHGVTAALARRHGIPDVRTLTVEQAVGIYWQEFWRPLGLEFVAGDSWRVAAEIFDTSANAGPGTASRIAQQAAVEIFGEDIKVDGWIGALTRAALGRIIHRGREEHLVAALNGFQFVHYLELLRKNHPAAPHAIEGWMRRLVTPQVEKGDVNGNPAKT